MDKEVLRRLEMLNQLALTDEEKERFLAFFDRRMAGAGRLAALDTESTERMVHVLPIENPLREDTASQPYAREALQASAPDAGEGYWRVPRVLE